MTKRHRRRGATRAWPEEIKKRYRKRTSCPPHLAEAVAGLEALGETELLGVARGTFPPEASERLHEALEPSPLPALARRRRRGSTTAP